jgi:hypothetical protein
MAEQGRTRQCRQRADEEQGRAKGRTDGIDEEQGMARHCRTEHGKTGTEQDRKRKGMIGQTKRRHDWAQQDKAEQRTAGQ